MLIRDDITFKHGKCLKNERIIALYSLLLIKLWFFWVVPIVGGIIGGLIYRTLLEKRN